MKVSISSAPCLWKWHVPLAMLPHKPALSDHFCAQLNYVTEPWRKDGFSLRYGHMLQNKPIEVHTYSRLYKCQGYSSVCLAWTSARSAGMWNTERSMVWVQLCLFVLHQLRLVYVGNPALQLLWLFREELEFGAVSFRVLPRVIITDLSWRRNQKKYSFKHIHKQIGTKKVSRIICGPSKLITLPQMTLMLISFCKEKLTRRPMFNLSAPPPDDLPFL